MTVVRYLTLCVSAIAAASAGNVIGILGSSGGDCQACSEVESFTKYFVEDGLLAAAPKFVGKGVSDLLWAEEKKRLSAEYHQLEGCNTHFRDRSVNQTELFVLESQKKLTNDTVLPFSGWKFNHGPGNPENITLEAGLEAAMNAGVTHLFMWDQDAIISSSVLNEVSFKIAKQFVTDNKWSVTIYGINGLNTQPDFMSRLLYPRIKYELESTFPSADPSDVCILAVGQGEPSFAKYFDPYSTVLTELASTVEKALTKQGYRFFFGWQNWSDGLKFPLTLIPWTSPSDGQLLNKTVSEESCSMVHVTDALQWPVSDVSTLVREKKYFKNWIEDLEPKKTLKVSMSWDSWPPLAEYFGEMVQGVMSGTGGYNITRVV